MLMRLDLVKDTRSWRCLLFDRLGSFCKVEIRDLKDGLSLLWK